jgi:hypothetical protein
MTDREPPAPGRVLRVGVTGHRALADEAGAAAAVRSVLDRLRKGAGGAALVVVSPLAEGADRLVAQAALDEPGARLVATLPLPPAEYVKDFATPGSRSEFEALLSQADETIVVPEESTRPHAYSAVGHWVLDHCDVLLALWDGGPARGRGGTAEIVAEARRRGIPVEVVDVTRPADPSAL